MGVSSWAWYEDNAKKREWAGFQASIYRVLLLKKRREGFQAISVAFKVLVTANRGYR